MEFNKLEHAARSRSSRGQQDQGARLWSEVMQQGRGAGVAATSLVSFVYFCTRIQCEH